MNFSLLHQITIIIIVWSRKKKYIEYWNFWYRHRLLWRRLYNCTVQKYKKYQKVPCMGCTKLLVYKEFVKHKRVCEKKQKKCYLCDVRFSGKSKHAHLKNKHGKILWYVFCIANPTRFCKTELGFSVKCRT
jgi:hypothetical protein